MAGWRGSVARAASVALVLAASAAIAQDASPVRVRGELASVSDRDLTVRSRDGGVVRLELAPDARIVGMIPVGIDAVTPETTIGAAAVEQPDGRQKALMVVVYPGTIGGAGEGYLSWDLAPDSKMVQGEVRGIKAGEGGQIVSIYYPQAGAELVVPPGTPVVKIEPGDAGLLKEGSQVFVPNAERGAGEALKADLVAVGKEGFSPPM